MNCEWPAVRQLWRWLQRTIQTTTRLASTFSATTRRSQYSATQCIRWRAVYRHTTRAQPRDVKTKRGNEPTACHVAPMTAAIVASNGHTKANQTIDQISQHLAAAPHLKKMFGDYLHQRKQRLHCPPCAVVTRCSGGMLSYGLPACAAILERI